MQKMKKDNKILYQIKCRLKKECVKLCIVVRLSSFLFLFTYFIYFLAGGLLFL